MQRNMLLAIALSVVIMVVWQMFFPAPQPNRRQASEQVGDQTAEQVPGAAVFPDSSTGQSAGQDAWPGEFPKASAPLSPELITIEEFADAQDIIVESDRLSAVFTTNGGRLVSLTLNEFDSKRGGKVEMIPPVQEGIGGGAAENERPLSLTFNDPRFGVRTDDFIYDYKEYGPFDMAISSLAEGLRACSGQIFSEAETAEIARQIDACLPETSPGTSPGANPDAELRSFVVATAAEAVAEAGSAEILSERADILEGGRHLIFSRKLTTQIKLIKAFSFPSGEFSFDMSTIVHNIGDEPLDLGRGRSAYSVVWQPGMETSERTAKEDPIQAISFVDEKYEQKALKKFKEARQYPNTLKWVGMKRKFFFLALEPRDGLVGATVHTQDAKKGVLRIGLDMSPMRLEPGEVAADTIRICAGPMLGEVLDSLGPDFGQVVNFGFFDFFGKIMLSGLLWFNTYVKSYGLAIILLTVVVRVGLFPLNQKSYKSMKEMQAIQPLVTELREKYKDKPQEMNKKMMELYREHKVNPLGGCLPMVFQMPIFIALFQALRNAVELRGAQFLWIIDLSEPDRLYTITSPFNFSLNLLPLLVIVAMLVQQKMTPMAAGGQNETQQKMMQYMPIFFGFIFYSMPSGLTVYFLITTVLGLVQQYFVQKAA
jgi:YidC/Oxa1 family membrane protein insertase